MLPWTYGPCHYDATLSKSVDSKTAEYRTVLQPVALGDALTNRSSIKRNMASMWRSIGMLARYQGRFQVGAYFNSRHISLRLFQLKYASMFLVEHRVFLFRFTFVSEHRFCMTKGASSVSRLTQLVRTCTHILLRRL